MLVEYGLLVFSLYLMILGLSLNTQNFLSATIFKVIPFLGGLVLFLYMAEVLNFLNLFGGT